MTGVTWHSAPDHIGLGLNLAGLESGIPGTGTSRDADNILQSADMALKVWNANLLRVTVSPDFWFGHDEKANLGEAADPASGERVLDLEQAKEAIDLLALLRVKTNGNRTDQESHLLEEILYDLQLRFVSAARSATGR